MLGFAPFTIYVTDTFVIVTIIVIVQSIAIIYLMINQTLIKIAKEKELIIIKKDNELIIIKKDYEKERDLIIMNKDNEKERDLIIMNKDNEKKRDLIIMNKDNEKERDLIIMNKDIKNKENYYMKQLSAMSQRQLIEALFNDIKVLYYKNENFHEMVASLDNQTYLKNFKKPYPTFSTINDLLSVTSVKEFLWKHFNFPETIKVPLLPSSLLYGALSDIIHNNLFSKVIISDVSTTDFKEFMTCLSNHYEKSLVEFNEEQSELDEVV